MAQLAAAPSHPATLLPRGVDNLLGGMVFLAGDLAAASFLDGDDTATASMRK